MLSEQQPSEASEITFSRPKKFPPGPINIPILGSLLYVDVRNLTKSFTKLSKKYGDIFSLFVGRTPVVVLNNYELIKSSFERMEFAGRPGNFSGTFFQKGKTGITTTEGRHWSTQREFLMKHLESLTGDFRWLWKILDILPVKDLELKLWRMLS